MNFTNELACVDQDIGLKLDKLFEGTGQNLHFEACKVGVETTNNNTGFFALIDSTAKNVGILWNAAASPTAQGSMVLENVQVDKTVGSVSHLFIPCSFNQKETNALC